MRVAVVTFPGSNCDRDVSVAVTNIIGKKPLSIWHQDHEIPNCDLIIIPGGFSYGDYLRCGAVAANSPIMREVKNHTSRGGAVLGICNGFQILTEANLLPGTLLKNRSLKFISKAVGINILRNDTFFTSCFQKDQTVFIPVAHHDGNFFIEKDSLMKIEDNNQVAMRYSEPVNGSCNDIAGLYNESFNVLGLMPHPERAVDKRTGSDDGIIFFKSMMKYINN